MDTVAHPPTPWRAALVTVLFTTSTTRGVMSAMAVAMGYNICDLWSVGRLLSLFGDETAFSWFSTLVDFDLGWRTAAWMLSENGAPVPGFALGGAIGVARYPSELHAFLVQAVYLLLFGALAFWLIRRRDVTGPSGS